MQTKTVRGLCFDGILSHDDYYSFLVEVIGRDRLIPLLPRGYERSTDDHLNDIPLKRWDIMDHLVHPMAHDKAAWFTMNTSKPCRAWSLSYSVCVLKTLAKQQMGRI